MHVDDWSVAAWEMETWWLRKHLKRPMGNPQMGDPWGRRQHLTSSNHCSGGDMRKNLVRSLQKEIKQLTAVRTTIESFDIKNAELLQRSGKGATDFTQKRWETLSVKIQAKSVVSDLITRTKGAMMLLLS